MSMSHVSTGTWVASVRWRHAGPGTNPRWRSSASGVGSHRRTDTDANEDTPGQVTVVLRLLPRR